MKEAPAQEAQEQATLDAWRDAHNAHDSARLSLVYGEQVRFYGAPLPRPRVVEAKRAAFAKSPSFHMSFVGPVQFEKGAEGDVVATFRKKSGDSPQGEREVDARVTLHREDGHFVIVEETDSPSERAAAAKQKTKGGLDAGDCETVARDAWSHLPAIVAYRARAQKAKLPPGGAVGGIDYPSSDEEPLSWSEGVHTSEAFHAEAFGSVSKDGVLSAMVFGEDVKVPATVSDQVRSACRRE